MRKFKRLTMTLALLIMAAGGAWAEETPLLTIESNGNRTFGNGSKTFGGMVTVTFSNSVSNDGDEFGWYTSGASLLTVAGTNGYTITSCKFYTDMGTASTGYTVVGESPSVYLSGSKVYTDDSKSVNIGQFGITKIEVYGTEPIELKPDDTGKNWFLAKMPASNVELQVEYEPTKVTMAANDKTMGTVEVSGESKVEWTADTWAGWTSSTKEYTVDDITMTSTQSAYINEYTNEDKYLHSLFFYVNQTDDNSTVTFSTTGDPFSRIEFTMIDDYAEDQWVSTKGVYLGNPVIMPKDNWTFEGKSAVWEGEATKSLTLQSCTTWVSKITFFKGAVPDGVTVNGDGTFTVAKTATVTLTATPAEGYKFLYWEDDQTNTNPVREVTIEPGEADMTYTAVFAEPTFNVTFVEGTNLDEWTATPNTEVKKDTKVDIKYTGTKKVIGVKAAKKKSVAEGKTLAEATVGMLVGSDGKTYAAADKNNLPEGVTAVALVCYVSDGHGLALALADESEKMIWNTAKSTCSGKTPAVTGCTWKLATQDEWNNMINAAGGFSALRDGFSSVGGTNMLSGSTDYYWSSTTTGYDCAWSCTFSTGNWTDDYADDYTTDYVRACLAF